MSLLICFYANNEFLEIRPKPSIQNNFLIYCISASCLTIGLSIYAN